ncbi:MAG: ABC transporter permease [Bacteroidota bacterium]
MFGSLLRVAFRSLRRNRGFAVLNVVGLALGMACVILIALFLRDELGFDRFHVNAERVVRIDTDFVVEGQSEPNTRSQGLLAPSLEASVPEVEATVRLMPAEPVIRVERGVFEPGQIYYADPDVFEVFTFPLVSGDPETALAEPGRVVLDESTALMLFGRTDVLGESLLSGETVLTVSGVMANVPRQSHLQFFALASLSTLEDPGWYYQNWFSGSFLTYALLREGTNVQSFRDKLPAFIESVAGDEMREMGQSIVLHATPLSRLYLHSDREASDVQGSTTILSILGAVALFVLLVAGINYTNLATARSLDRAREVGVRKTLGASRSSLAAQFLVEAVALSTVAFALGLIVVQVVLPVFNALAEKPLTILDLGPWAVGLAWLALVVGVVAGAYPALVLSGYRPVDVLKGTFAAGQQGLVLRRGLVVLQFVVSIGLIAGTAVVFSQLDYMQSKDLGLDLGGDATQLLVLPLGGDDSVADRLPETKRRLLSLQGVNGVTSSIAVPTGGNPGAGGELEGPDGSRRQLGVTMYLVDSSFVDVYGLEIVAGVTPGSAALADSGSVYVLNETAVRESGYAQLSDVLGKQASFWGAEGEVVGVVKDFHTEGLQNAVEPLALRVTPLYQSVLTLRVQTADLPATLSAIGKVWPEVAPSQPFSYSFLDEDFGAQYVAERRFGRLFSMLASLAIIIACLGLFGLAAFETSTRKKEIGVRRVLGATVGQIVRLFSRDVVLLVGVALGLASPLVVFWADHWLGGFAYSAPFGGPVLAVAGVVVCAVALVTVGSQVVLAATADPIHSLRSE